MKRASAAWVLARVAFVLTLAGNAAAQVFEIPLGDYSGKMKVRTSHCTVSGDNFKFQLSGPITVISQSGARFQARGQVTTRRFGLDFRLEIDLEGTIDHESKLRGLFDHRFSGGGFSSTGSGSFTGSAKPGKLSIRIEGIDEDNSGRLCRIRGSFTGQGSRGASACAAQLAMGSARLCKKSLFCHRRFVRNPGLDPGGFKRDSCLGRAAARFISKVGRTVNNQRKDGGTCTYDDPGDALAGSVQSFAERLKDDISNGVDNSDEDDRKLRAFVIERAAFMCSKALVAESRNLKRPNLRKLRASRTKARQTFLRREQRAIGKAAGKGVRYAGLAPASIADAIDGMVDTVVGAFR